MNYVGDSTVEHMEKGENAGYLSIFSFSYNVFIALFFSVIKSLDCVIKVKPLLNIEHTH